ncbi:hypothetical protein [Rhodanobacter lindaniclasticus]
MSANAAHRTIDFAERMRPQAESLTINAAEMLKWTQSNEPASVLARESVMFADGCREGLAELVVAQSWQDLTGQRIKKVDGFIGSGRVDPAGTGARSPARWRAATCRPARPRSPARRRPTACSANFGF